MIHFLIAMLAAAAWLFISGAIIFAALLPRWFQAHFGHIARDKTDLPLWAIIIEKLLQGAGITLLIYWSSQPVIYLSIIPVLLVTGTYFFSTYATYNVKARPVGWIALMDGARLVIASIVSGLLLGRALC
ncbi:hypothetical protein CLV51_101795 [Chitinophaga niastensis]|uniref:Uncharacterized protein n=1 Tax=Chitinophaga niastensis TaxID=536980 RepID=A0A2P8HTD8_CHINA|nr:hypothetical protein [Chitinophaga niastensis]PSL49462.1 hypothetical protein CLV51_101795 [Chitinophaga niastensis]